MAIDKAVDSTELDSGLTTIANAIRTKGGTSEQLSFPNGMADAIAAIPSGGIDPEAYQWQQTPVPVQRYLDEVTYTYTNPAVYSSADYSTSQITIYTAIGDGERPIGQVVNFDESGELNQGGYRKTVDSGDSTLYNAIPKIKTPYTLTSTDNGVKSAGTLKPTKNLRQINVNTHNVRDLGGWACDGGTIKYGKLFRGGEVSNSDDIDIFLNQLCIRAELDLQGTSGSTIHVLSDVVDYCCPENGENWALYTLVHKEQMREAFRFIFNSVKSNKPLYFHCTYGADRTGTIACLIESLLGVSRSDLDKDWEITSFYSTRQRIQTGESGGYGKLWQELLSQISSNAGSTWRDKAVNYIASLGFTATEINAFRESMIDGNPETVTPDIDTFTVTNNLSHASSDNAATSATEYQPYEANITPASGCVISSVQILMNGVDITDNVWLGEQTNLYRSVAKTLSHCTIDNQKIAVIDGQGYAAEITVDAGYTLDGATVSITMGGTDITNQVWMTTEDI